MIACVHRSNKGISYHAACRNTTDDYDNMCNILRGEEISTMRYKYAWSSNNVQCSKHILKLLYYHKMTIISQICAIMLIILRNT